MNNEKKDKPTDWDFLENWKKQECSVSFECSTCYQYYTSSIPDNPSSQDSRMVFWECPKCGKEHCQTWGELKKVQIIVDRIFNVLENKLSEWGNWNITIRVCSRDSGDPYEITNFDIGENEILCEC